MVQSKFLFPLVPLLHEIRSAGTYSTFSCIEVLHKSIYFAVGFHRIWEIISISAPVSHIKGFISFQRKIFIIFYCWWWRRLIFVLWSKVPHTEAEFGSVQLVFASTIGVIDLVVVIGSRSGRKIILLLHFRCFRSRGRSEVILFYFLKALITPNKASTTISSFDIDLQGLTSTPW